MHVKIDREFKSLIPPLSSEERAGLEADILRDGRATVPLIVWGEVLLDGHNRYEICATHKLPYTTQPAPAWIKDRRDARIWIRTTALNRRNLGPVTRAELAMGNEADIAAKNAEIRKSTLKQNASKQPAPTKKSAEAVVKNPTQRQSVNDRKTRAQAAKAAGMSHPTYEAAKVIATKAAPELRAAVDRGDIAVSTGAQLAALPVEKQREVASSPQAAKQAAKAVRQDKLEAKRQQRVEKIAELSKSNEPLLDRLGTFPVIYADPPWRYEHMISESRAIENQYPTMTLEEICALPVAKIATPDAWLFLWATSPMLEKAMCVIQAWGFEYRTCAVWVKCSDKRCATCGELKHGQIGMGYVYRQRHELLLVAKRGTPPTPSPADRPDSVIEAPDGEHSTKPEIVRKQIERMFPKWKRIELFARTAPDGWSVWGNQAR